MRTVIASILLSVTTLSVVAQKQTEVRDQTWFGYFNQTRFTKRSGLWADLHLRLTDNFVNQRSITIARLAYIYYITDQTRIMAGYAYANQYSAVGPNIPEHRPWQQIQWLDKKDGFNLMQWLRIEERYRTKVAAGELTNDYNFNWRLRYNFALTFPLKGKQVAAKTPFLFFNNEIHVNAGKSIVNNYFDQNRLFFGLGYQFTSHINAHLGYMNVFQQLPAGNQYVSTNAIRLFVFHNIDLRRQE
jgi:hypothetical protein